ncbi:hypothetical protein C8J56DRAFT_820797 [Mycena floridula]|nr:hypothetical protein C8J56DRAFT_820797 [Mycena floridula]
MASILRAYNASLIRRPMVTQCCTAAFLFGAGDVIAQQAYENAGSKHDFKRTARLSFYGGCLFGPAMTIWYQFLNRIQFSTPTKSLIYRVYLDQAILTPVAVGFFFTSMSVLEGKPEEIVSRLEDNYLPTIIRNWAVFLPTQIVNFGIVPPRLRFVVVSLVSLAWNTYLSAVNAEATQNAVNNGVVGSRVVDIN